MQSAVEDIICIEKKIAKGGYSKSICCAFNFLFLRKIPPFELEV